MTAKYCNAATSSNIGFAVLAGLACCQVRAGLMDLQEPKERFFRRIETVREFCQAVDSRDPAKLGSVLFDGDCADAETADLRAEFISGFVAKLDDVGFFVPMEVFDPESGGSSELRWNTRIPLNQSVQLEIRVPGMFPSRIAFNFYDSSRCSRVSFLSSRFGSVFAFEFFGIDEKYFRLFPFGDEEERRASCNPVGSVFLERAWSRFSETAGRLEQGNPTVADCFVPVERFFWRMEAGCPGANPDWDAKDFATISRMKKFLSPLETYCSSIPWVSIPLTGRGTFEIQLWSVVDGNGGAGKIETKVFPVEFRDDSPPVLVEDGISRDGVLIVPPDRKSL